MRTVHQVAERLRVAGLDTPCRFLYPDTLIDNMLRAFLQYRRERVARPLEFVDTDLRRFLFDPSFFDKRSSACSHSSLLVRYSVSDRERRMPVCPTTRATSCKLNGTCRCARVSQLRNNKCPFCAYATEN